MARFVLLLKSKHVCFSPENRTQVILAALSCLVAPLLGWKHFLMSLVYLGFPSG